MKQAIQLYREDFLYSVEVFFQQTAVRFSLRLFAVLFILSLVITGKSFGQGSTSFETMYPKPIATGIIGIQAFDMSTWYGITETGTFFKTTNAGANWSYQHGLFLDPTTGFKLGYGAMHFINSNTGWVSSNNGLIAKTMDGGNTWIQTPLPGVTSGISNLFFLNDNTGYAVGASPNILGKTTNGGASWFVVDSLPANGLGFYALNESVMFFGSGTASSYKSTNGGLSWSLMQLSVSGSVPVTSIKFANDSLGAILASGSIYVTTNGGSNWVDRKQGSLLNGSYDLDLLVKGDSVYAYVTGNKNYIYKDVINNDTTPSWEAIDFRESPDQFTDLMRSTYLFGEDSLITAGFQGVINTMYSKKKKKAFSNRINDMRPADIWVSSDGNKIISSGFDSTILYTDNGGNNWDTLSIPNSSLDGGIEMINDNTGWILDASCRVYKTVDGGDNWTHIGTSDTTKAGMYIDFVNENTGWIIQSGYLAKTTNSGVNWVEQTPTGLSRISMVTPAIGYACSTDGVIKTTNGGENWTTVGSFGPILFDIFMLNANTGWVCGINSTVRRTTTGGATWDSLSLPFPGMYPNKINFFDESNGMMTSLGGAILITHDGGNTWEYSFSEGSTMYGLQMTSPTKAYISEFFGGAIIKYEELLTGNTYSGNEVPADYSLGQNYPNPFNPSTTIKFSLPKASTISLKVYDMAGREVASLFNNKELNAGTFEQRFNGSNLASGVYFYTLVADGQLIASKKMMLVK